MSCILARCTHSLPTPCESEAPFDHRLEPVEEIVVLAVREKDEFLLQPLPRRVVSDEPSHRKHRAWYA